MINICSVQNRATDLAFHGDGQSILRCRNRLISITNRLMTTFADSNQNHLLDPIGLAELPNLGNRCGCPMQAVARAVGDDHSKCRSRSFEFLKCRETRPRTAGTMHAHGRAATVPFVGGP